MRIRAEDLVTFGYLTIVALIVIVYHERVSDWVIYSGAHLIGASLVLFIIRIAAKCPNRYLIFARNWYHVPFVILAFRELNYLIHPIHPNDIDPILVKIDHFIFGVHPTVWLERWTFPLLTEYLQIMYSTFYFIPVTLVSILWCKGKFTEFQEVVLAIVTTFYLSFLGYMVFPALGPRFTITHLQNIPLEGILFTQWLRDTLNVLEMIQRDAFPSGHTGVTLIILYYAYRFERMSFPFFLVIISSLIFSTVYLRYHYVIDVVAGFALAGISLAMAVSLNRWWKGKKGEDMIPV